MGDELWSLPAPRPAGSYMPAGGTPGYLSSLFQNNVSDQAQAASGGFSAASLANLGLNPPANANGSGLGWNAPTVGLALNGISQLGGLYLGMKQLGLAKDSFKFQKQAYKTDLANKTQSYNTQISDRAAGRNYASEEERQAAIKAASLPTAG